ncbi:MAG: hypothetical protein LBG99_03445 [Propionibacteriaceae bacterium]|jgi:hypothetical protein|nr:hypothetical protein [Propionibacteriaceae bacterium]
MAYTVVRIKLGIWKERFKETPTDSDFDVDTYPEMDEYLSTMEERGWSIVNTAVSSGSNGVAYYLLVTLHRPEV